MVANLAQRMSSTGIALGGYRFPNLCRRVKKKRHVSLELPISQMSLCPSHFPAKRDVHTVKVKSKNGYGFAV